MPATWITYLTKYSTSKNGCWTDRLVHSFALLKNFQMWQHLGNRPPSSPFPSHPRSVPSNLEQGSAITGLMDLFSNKKSVIAHPKRAVRAKVLWAVMFRAQSVVVIGGRLSAAAASISTVVPLLQRRYCGSSDSARPRFLWFASYWFWHRRLNLNRIFA